MRALLSGENLGIDGLSLDDLPKPEPGPGEVCIRVEAVGINYPDTLIVEDRYQYKPARPFAPGGELAGTIDSWSENVEGFRAGERVLAMTLSGALAEYVVVPANRVHRIPDTLPADQAAALMLTYGTAMHALTDRAGLHAGETVLVLGAAGGVGLAAVEIARALGAKVVAAVSSEEKAHLAREAGAHHAVVYPADPIDTKAQRELTAQFKAACGVGADIVVDPVGGPYSEAALRAIAWHGRFLVVGFPAGIAQIPLNLPLLKACQIMGIFFGGELERDQVDFADCADRLIDLCVRGSLQPRIDRHFALAEGAEAIRLLAQRKARGKVVVMVRQ
jgi:NADPH2:quinone reductase